MKITDVKIQALQVPLAKPLHISLGVVTDAISALVMIETDEGITGYGEGSPGVLITGENLPGTMESLKVFRSKLIGMDPLDLEAVSVMMNRETYLAGAAKCAIDLACHDIVGRKAGLPLYKLLGGQSNRIVTDMTVGIAEPEVMAEKARGYVEEGFDTIKTKVGTDPALDLARVKAIREAVGDSVKIRLDANQGWHAKKAVNIINRLNEYDIELVEQPVRRSDFEGLIYVTANSPVPIMADESCWDSKDAIQLISRRAVDLINIKLMKCGGLREAQKICAIAESAGVEIMLGCMAEEGGIAINAAASLGAALNIVTRADLDNTWSLKEIPFEGGFHIENANTLVLSDQPGSGIVRLK